MTTIHTYDRTTPLKLEFTKNGLDFAYSPLLPTNPNAQVYAVIDPGTFKQRSGGPHFGVFIGTEGVFPGGKHCGPVVRRGRQLWQQGIGTIGYFDNNGALATTRGERWLANSPWLALTTHYQVAPYYGKFNITIGFTNQYHRLDITYRKGAVAGVGDILTQHSHYNLGQAEAGFPFALTSLVGCGFFIIGDFVEPNTTGCVEASGVSQADQGKHLTIERYTLRAHD